MKRFPQILLTGAALLALASPTAAQSAAPMTDAEVTGRLAYIQSALDGGRRAADLWSRGWLAGYSVAAAGQLAARRSSNDEQQRQDLLVGATTSALGAVGMVVFPVEAGAFARRLHAAPGDTPEARRAKLAEAERYLRTAAAQESLGRSWKSHAAAAAVNLAAGLVVWKHYDRPAADGLLTFAFGQLVSEVQIFTQPTRASRDLEEYESRRDFEPLTSSSRPRPDWYVGAAPGGVVVGVRF